MAEKCDTLSHDWLIQTCPSAIQQNMELKVLESEKEIYKTEKLLGQGAFGKAYLVRQIQTNELMVIKEMNVEHMSKEERQETVREALILKNFNHPGIVKFIEVYMTTKNKLKIVMEYAECGDVAKAISQAKADKRPFEENHILDWFTQMCLAVKHVHDRKILHRDIKGQNIFITINNTLKLGDFGIARVLNQTQDKARTVVGTPYYLSPEIIQNKPYSFKSDIWAIGVVLYELCALQPPFTANSLQFLALKIVKGSYPPIPANYSYDLKAIVKEMLQIDPNKRPLVSDILRKPFIQDRIRKYLTETCRQVEFSHTVLHNQRVDLAPRFQKAEPNREASREKIQSKEEEAALLQRRLQKKREEDRMREEQRLVRLREEQGRKLQKRQQYERQRQRLQEMKKAEEERERRRVQQIAEYARRKQKDEYELRRKRDALMREKQIIDSERKIEKDQRKKVEKEQLEKKKIEELNEFNRLQFHENQRIRKMAIERAKQSQYETVSTVESQPPQQIHSRPKSTQQFQKAPDKQSRIEKQSPLEKQSHMEKQLPPKKNSQNSQREPTEEQLQNAMVNPNFLRRPSQPEPQNKRQNPPPKKQIEKKEEINQKPKHESVRDQIKKDREQFQKEKNIQKDQIEILTVGKERQPAKWEKKSLSKEKNNSSERPSTSREKYSPKEEPMEESKSLVQQYRKMEDTEFCDFRKELECVLDNVNRKVEEAQAFSKMPINEEIVCRDDDLVDLSFSLTNPNLAEPHPQIQESVDLDYFCDYSKLQTLRINLQDKFGTDKFITIYRALEKELSLKDLQQFDIMSVVSNLGSQIDINLLSENLPLLLTLVIMQEKMNSA